MERTICASGREGWTCKLQDNYNHDYDVFVVYDETYGIAGRLGFTSAKAAWEQNPQIRGSTIPSDLEVVT